MGMGCSGRWCGAGVLHLLLLLSLVGCGSMADRAPTATSEPMRILDPVVAFAADPSVNGEAQVVLPDTGESVRLRLVRQYAAASGRECREAARPPGQRCVGTRYGVCTASYGSRPIPSLLNAGNTRPHAKLSI